MRHPTPAHTLCFPLSTQLAWPDFSVRLTTFIPLRQTGQDFPKLTKNRESSDLPPGELFRGYASRYEIDLGQSKINQLFPDKAISDLFQRWASTYPPTDAV